VHRAVEIVYEHPGLNAILIIALLGKFNFLFPSLMGAVMLSWMWLADVDGEKFKSQIAIISVELVEGRDLAHEGWSRDAAKFQQYMLLIAEVRKPHSLAIETWQLEI
jgi:hypothetical protein